MMARFLLPGHRFQIARLGKAIAERSQPPQRGQAKGAFRSDDSLQMAQTAWAFVHGIATLAIDGQLSISPGEAFDRFLQFSTRMLIEGFAAD